MNENYTLSQYIKNEHIFENKSYSFHEYMTQLSLLEQKITKYVFKNNYHQLYNLDDVLHELKKQAIQTDLIASNEYKNALQSIKLIRKELAIGNSGKFAEDYVNNLICSFVTRKDFKNYQGIYFKENDLEDTEIDQVILTKSGIILLEIKNIRKDITITNEGRLFIGKEESYEKTPLVEKMERKRTFLRKHLQEKLKEKGVHISICLQSFIVFNEPADTSCYIHNYSDEYWCKSKQLPKIINNHYSSFPYSDNEFNILHECFSEFETNKKAFNPDIDIHSCIKSIEQLLNLLCKNEDVITKENKLIINSIVQNFELNYKKDFKHKFETNSIHKLIPMQNRLLSNSNINT